MADPSHDDGVIVAVIERFEKYRLPRALDMKAKVERGERLGDTEIAYLKRLLDDAQDVKRLVDKRPDLQGLYTRAVGLYQEITQKALENERNA
ncbi:hypothetical protein G3480_24320 [Thiorhodococcus mannitoliphagus]|uniref:Uncharacterized protein n=1 Tax=Thiorhodococcus mannitoliphagus TaxID=329406 RepID=A0A6P1E0R2_9GAMM|nr:hypothetical protein [Thiorhodococcus mannitoliphagus]NEX23380.1 hypothetical protein [Thiorhodococcus mannitoliphagus]